MNIAFTSVGSALVAKLNHFALKHWVWSCCTRASFTKQGRWSWHLKNWAVVSQVRPIDVNLNPTEKSKLMSQRNVLVLCVWPPDLNICWFQGKNNFKKLDLEFIFNYFERLWCFKRRYCFSVIKNMHCKCCHARKQLCSLLPSQESPKSAWKELN